MSIQMAHDIDPKDRVLSDLGDISGIRLLNNQVLIAVYIRPEKTKGGIIMTDRVRDEDRFQSKVGLIVAMGPSAFKEDDEAKWFGGINFNLGDWILFRPSDGWTVTVNGVSCKILSDTQVKGVISDNVDMVW